MRRAESKKQGQRGVALFMVVMLLLLAALVVCGAARVMLLNESQVGNSADRSRAFAAAEALMHDAETDIRGTWPDGSPCLPDPAAQACRNADAEFAFPAQPGDYERLKQALQSAPAALPCRQGICAPAIPGRLADLIRQLADEHDLLGKPSALAGYGQFTRPGKSPPKTGGNPYLLQDAWYWVEVLPYPALPTDEAAAMRLAPDPTQPFVFRITAFVSGHRPGTQVVLQEYFIPSPLMGNP